MSEKGSTPSAAEKMSTETLLAMLREMKDPVWIEKPRGTFTVRERTNGNERTKPVPCSSEG